MPLPNVWVSSAVAALCVIPLLCYHPPFHALERTYYRSVPLEKTAFAENEINSYLRLHTKHLAAGRTPGQETVAVDSQGKIYVFEESGWLLRIHEDATSAVDRVMFVGGRVLGSVSLNDSTIIACDIAKGLISIDIVQGVITVLATHAEGDPILYCDDVDVAPDGTIYFSDAMATAPARQTNGKWSSMELSMVDFHRGRGSGRMIQYNPQTRQTTVLLRDLFFANGVAVSQDGSFVVVAETFNMRLIRYFVSGPRAGFHDLFALLPAFPDGVSRATDGSGFWVACPSIADSKAVFVSEHPWVRWLMGNAPRWLWPKPTPYGLVVKLRNNGDVEYMLHDPTGENVRFVSGVTQHDSLLYLGQLHGDSVPVVPIPPLLHKTHTSTSNNNDHKRTAQQKQQQHKEKEDPEL